MATTSLGLEQVERLLEQIGAVDANIAVGEDILRREAEAFTALLERVVKPVMRLVDRPVVSRVYHGKKEYLPERGIVFADYIRSAPQDAAYHGAYRGTYHGFKLVFLRSGKLLKMDISGTWDAFESPLTCEFAVHEMSPAETLRWVDLATCLGGVMACLNEAIRNAEAKKETLAPRLAALTKVEACLGGLTK
jgi:hypothetical protein